MFSDHRLTADGNIFVLTGSPERVINNKNKKLTSLHYQAVDLNKKKNGSEQQRETYFSNRIHN